MPAPKTSTVIIVVMSGVTVTSRCRPMRYTIAEVNWLAATADSSGMIHSTGLRYVSSNSTATIPAAARNSVVSTPSPISSMSASAPASPVTAVRSPAGESASTALTCCTASLPGTGNDSSSACPSRLAVTGPTT
ncbi:hypothetical protein GCM10027610_065770 [Dactylosporangium cerinum]